MGHGAIEASLSVLSDCGYGYENFENFSNIVFGNMNFAQFVDNLTRSLPLNFLYCTKQFPKISIGLLIYYLMEHPEARERMYTAFNERGLGSFAGWLQFNFAQPQQ